MQLPPQVQHKIQTTGIRNSHLTSIAPTGTISLTADNVSSGIEPLFALFYDRTIEGFDGQSIERVEDYAYSLGIKGCTANEISADEHERAEAVSMFVDSAVSKTATWVTMLPTTSSTPSPSMARRLKGITTFRAAGKRYGILNEANDNEPEDNAQACFIDPETGQKECD